MNKGTGIQTRITIYRSYPHAIQTGAASPSVSQVTLSFEELKLWLRSGKILRHLFRYDQSVMVTFDLRLIGKPFVTALLMWALARKQTLLKDDQGVVREVRLGFLFSLFKKFAMDLASKASFFCTLKAQVGKLDSDVKTVMKPLDMKGLPIYLRTDLVFGLRSGGSVGHIAGVLNQLDQFCAKPVFLTSDLIPTVREDIETHVIRPGNAFWDFSEVPLFDFNGTFYDEALKTLGDRQVSFIYQRYSLNNFAGLRLARHYQVPFVLEYNGSEIWINRNWGHPLKYEDLADRIEMLDLSQSDLIVVVSGPMKDELTRRGIESAKILVNPNGVDPEKYAPTVDGTQVRQKYNFERKKVLGFIGTFGPWHGAEMLAEAFGELIGRFPEYRDRVRLLMIGDGGTMSHVKEVLAKYGVSDLCVLTGSIPQKEGPAHLAACDILVSPHVPNPDGTPFFGSPTKLFEYMAMGKGVVASDLDQIGEILRHDETAWMVKPGDIEDLMMGLKTLLDDEVRCSRLGQAARREAVAKYTWKEHTRRIIEKLKESQG